MDAVDAAPVMVLAEGLLMYLDPREARRLIVDCAARFPGGRMLFDSISIDRPNVSSRPLTSAYTTPPMPFALRPSQARALPRRVERIATATDVAWPRGRGMFAIFPTLARVPVLGDHRPSITLLTFAS